MKVMILKEIKSLVILNSHQCFCNIREENNQIRILKSEYVGSSTIEIRELIAIYTILDKYKK